MTGSAWIVKDDQLEPRQRVHVSGTRPAVLYERRGTHLYETGKSRLYVIAISTVPEEVRVGNAIL